MVPVTELETEIMENDANDANYDWKFGNFYIYYNNHYFTFLNAKFTFVLSIDKLHHFRFLGEKNWNFWLVLFNLLVKFWKYMVMIHYWEIIRVKFRLISAFSFYMYIWIKRNKSFKFIKIEMEISITGNFGGN